MYFLRQRYLFAIGRNTKGVVATLRAVLDGESTLEEWVKLVHFRDGWLVSAARATLMLWKQSAFNGSLRSL